MVVVPGFTLEGRKRLAEMVKDRLRALGLTVNSSSFWISRKLGPGEKGISIQAVRCLVNVGYGPSWRTLAVLSVTIFPEYSVYDLAAIACGEDPAKTTGHLSRSTASAS